MQYLTDPEALELYEAWLQRVAHTVRRAHARANGRRESDAADLAALRRDLASVNLRSLERDEPDAVFGTSLSAAQKAREFLTFAENDHSKGEHLAAILWLQQAYLSARLALELDGATRRPGAKSGTRGEPGERLDTDLTQPPADLRPGAPGHSRWFQIPKQRDHRKPRQE
jgi:hypothetical protein